MATRREFVYRSLMAAAATRLPGFSLFDGRAAGTDAAAFELAELSIPQLQAGLQSGRWSSVQMVQQYLERMAPLDLKGPALRALIETNAAAEAIAAGLDAERRNGQVRGPLHGIPIIIKDNIGTADGMHTSSGSLALTEAPAPADAFAVERLRAAGAIILAKSNMSEWSSFRSTHPSSGWSARGGQGRNPYALDRSPAGSSSGTAAAVACSYAAAGLGTETDGSIVCPSSACSIVGLKPTVGLVSRSGIIPVSHSQDTIGPMGRTVTDVAILLNAITGEDAADRATAGSTAHHTDYTTFLRPDSLRGARIGIWRSTMSGYSASDVAENAVAAMRDAGAIIIPSADIPHVDEYGDSEFTVLLYEFKHGINRYLAGLDPAVTCRSLEDLITFNQLNAPLELRHFGQEIFEMAVEKGGLEEKEYLAALAHNIRMSRKEGIDSIMNEHRLDALISPTMQPAWPIDLVNGDPVTGSSSSPAAVAGYPSISMPIGYEDGIPAGLSFIGRAWSEPVLIGLAYALEQILRARRPPRFLVTAQYD